MRSSSSRQTTNRASSTTARQPALCSSRVSESRSLDQCVRFSVAADPKVHGAGQRVPTTCWPSGGRTERTEDADRAARSLVSRRPVRIVDDRAQAALDLALGHERPVLRVEQRHVVWSEGKQEEAGTSGEAGSVERGEPRTDLAAPDDDDVPATAFGLHLAPALSPRHARRPEQALVLAHVELLAAADDVGRELARAQVVDERQRREDERRRPRELDVVRR